MSDKNFHEDHVHFDLGVDALADSKEIHDMHDPWVGEPKGMEHHAAPSMQDNRPPRDLGDSSGLPGM